MFSFIILDRQLNPVEYTLIKKVERKGYLAEAVTQQNTKFQVTALQLPLSNVRCIKSDFMQTNKAFNKVRVAYVRKNKT
ncbi:MAG: hypothetical protein H6662_14270 [Ardenticatenaceae bacterium]|nr:hypothetical protein [Ardenticatenaceae bacterium]MCB9003546.1 hypothetical protein [Ardenticatenaceae bacterium]